MGDANICIMIDRFTAETALQLNYIYHIVFYQDGLTSTLNQLTEERVPFFGIVKVCVYYLSNFLSALFQIIIIVYMSVS